MNSILKQHQGLIHKAIQGDKSALRTLLEQIYQEGYSDGREDFAQEVVFQPNGGSNRLGIGDCDFSSPSLKNALSLNRLTD